MRELICILSTPIDVLDTQGVVARLDQFIQEKRFHQVATANTDFVINAMADKELRHILRYSDLVMPDGMPLVWASRALGSPLPERVTGADIVPALTELSARKGYRIYMLGARPEVAQKAREKMLEAYPSLRIVGCVSPSVLPLEEMNNTEILKDIQAAHPDILLVAFGNPKQEKWIHRNRESLQNIPICIGVGGTFDFMAGQTTRAPAWMRGIGLEWLFRLAQEPQRLWKRYTRDIVHFGRYFGAQWVSNRVSSSSAKTLWTETPRGSAVILSVEGPLNSGQRAELQNRAGRILDKPANLILDLTAASSLDATIIGTLLNLPRRAEFVEREVCIVGVNARLLRSLQVLYASEALNLKGTLEEALKNLHENISPSSEDSKEDSKEDTNDAAERAIFGVNSRTGASR